MNWHNDSINLNQSGEGSLNYEINSDAENHLQRFSNAREMMRADQSERSDIYDLIGMSSMSRSATKSEASVDDLIRSLHEQYCRVLSDPFAPLGSERTMPPASDHHSLEPTHSEAAFNDQSIETLLAGARRLDAWLSGFGHHDASDIAAAEAVPEILRLFAPPEFKAAPVPLPPVLVRREHHAVGIDSPLMVQGVASDASTIRTER